MTTHAPPLGKRERQIAHQETRRGRPWTIDELERVRQAARDLTRSHQPYIDASGEIRASFSGQSYWALLGALDRAGSEQNEKG